MLLPFIIIAVCFLANCAPFNEYMGCAPLNDYNRVKDRLIALEKIIELDAGKIPVSTMLLAEEAGARKAWWRNGLEGGGTALDGINDSYLTDGDLGIVAVISGTTVDLYFYIYDETDASNDSPRVIQPNSGNGAWLLCDVHGKQIESDASGDSYIKILQANTPSTLEEGMIWYDSVDNRLEYYNGTNTVYIQTTNTVLNE